MSLHVTQPGVHQALLHQAVPSCGTGAVSCAGPGSSLLGAAAVALLGAIGKSFDAAAAWLLDQVGHVLSTSSEPPLGAPWFAGHARLMEDVAGFVALPLLLGAVMQGVVRQDTGAIVRAVVLQLPLAAVLGAASLGLVQVAVAVTNVLSRDLARSSGFDPAALMTQLAGGVGGTGPSAPPLVTLVLAALLGAASLGLWLELILRSAAILAATMFMPLALAGMIWPVTTAWARRLAETLMALIFSKLVMVAVLALGASAMVSGGRHLDVASLLSGAALLLMATFSPFALLRMVPFIESGAVGHLEGTGRRALRAVPAAASLGSRLAQMTGGEDGVLDPSNEPSFPPLAEPTGVPAEFEALLAREGIEYSNGEVRRIPPVRPARSVPDGAADGGTSEGSSSQGAGEGTGRLPEGGLPDGRLAGGEPPLGSAALVDDPAGVPGSSGRTANDRADFDAAAREVEGADVDRRGPERSVGSHDTSETEAGDDPWGNGDWWADSGE
ncbi:MAG: hypothetical protein M0Z87_00605 [Actinomycetota bacterium]|nr:hypothetical protein [Actinomycetota bacterium]